MPLKNPLPSDISRKIYKTGQTRGADDDVIYQNRVGRNSTALIPFDEYERCRNAPDNKGVYENGYIVLIKPEEYFDTTTKSKIPELGLSLGENLLVFYETRFQWENYPILEGWNPATSRINPLGGQYVARVPAITSTAAGSGKINLGFTSTELKGAGIRVYEYASNDIINKCRLQLEYVFWQCADIEDFISHSGLDEKELRTRKAAIEKMAKDAQLADKNQLIKARIINKFGHTICPLCLKEISSVSFGAKMQLAEGRDVPDLTVTEVSLFHIRELRTGKFNHRPYNLGWGHHFCNVVVKDSGISETLQWMRGVLSDNGML